MGETSTASCVFLLPIPRSHCPSLCTIREPAGSAVVLPHLVQLLPLGTRALLLALACSMSPWMLPGQSWAYLSRWAGMELKVWYPEFVLGCLPQECFSHVVSSVCFALDIRAVLCPCPFEFHDHPVMCRYLQLTAKNWGPREWLFPRSNSWLPLRPEAWLPHRVQLVRLLPPHPCPSSTSSSHPFPLRTTPGPSAVSFTWLWKAHYLRLSCLVIQSLSYLLNFSGVYTYSSKKIINKCLAYTLLYLLPLPHPYPPNKTQLRV